MSSRAQAEQGLIELARAGSGQGRARLVEALRRAGEAPGALDTADAQARVADLLWTLLTHAEPAQRAELSGQLAAAAWLPAGIAERLTAEALEAGASPALLAGLAANPGLSHALLSQLADIAATSPWVRAPLARHPRLTPRLASAIHRGAGADLRRELEARFPELAGGAAVAADDSGEALIAKLHAAGELGPGRLLRFLREGRLDLFEGGLAALTGRSRLEVEIVGADPSDFRFVAICSAAGFDRSVIPSVRALVADLAGPQPLVMHAARA